MLETQRSDLSKNFWNGYNDIKEYKPIHKSGRSDIAVESKAHENLKIALKIIDPKDSSTIEFIKTLKNIILFRSEHLVELEENKYQKQLLKKQKDYFLMK